MGHLHLLHAEAGDGSVDRRLEGGGGIARRVMIFPARVLKSSADSAGAMAIASALPLVRLPNALALPQNACRCWAANAAAVSVRAVRLARTPQRPPYSRYWCRRKADRPSADMTARPNTAPARVNACITVRPTRRSPRTAPPPRSTPPTGPPRASPWPRVHDRPGTGRSPFREGRTSAGRRAYGRVDRSPDPTARPAPSRCASSSGGQDRRFGPALPWSRTCDPLSSLCDG